ncbi:MAG: PIG-L family deacetylase [Candidatus Omnitrophota bacterium]
MKENKVLVIAAHMDDEVLGCAGTILKHKKCKDKVAVAFIANRIYGHSFDEAKYQREKKHCLKAKAVLGYDTAVFMNKDDERLDSCIQDIILPLEKIVNSFKPDIVYVPFRGDNNQDHRAVFDACRVVLRPVSTGYIKYIFMYEVPSSTDQSPPLSESAFVPNHYVDIDAHINSKIRAFACYKTETRRYPHPRSGNSIKILSQKRGIESGFKHAEAFMTLRTKWF